jgi:hypothetical protein
VQECVQLLGRDQAEFRRNAPAWAGDEVRPYLAAHAHLLGSFTEFHRLGSFQRLTLSWRIFGRDRVDGEIARVRAVLAEWGYRLGRDDDPLLLMVLCQLFLLNRSPHLADLSTELFDRVRRDRLLEGSRLNTLHALQRAVSALGCCVTCRARASAVTRRGRPVARKSGNRGSTAGLDVDAPTRQCPVHPAQGRPLARGRARCRPGGMDPADLRGLGRRVGSDERR